MTGNAPGVDAFTFQKVPDTMKKYLIPSALAAGLLAVALGTNANHLSEESLLDRVGPVGSLNVGEVPAAPAPAAAADDGPVDGASVYASACAACHDAGIGGAPTTGAAEDWVARISQGLDTLVSHAIEGFQGDAGVMPAKGGNPALSDEQVTAAVEHMVELSQ